MSTRAVPLLCLLAWTVPASSQPVADSGQAALSVCLQANDPPLSLRDGDHPAGFTLALAHRLAQQLDRPLRVQWFVSRDDPDANLVRDANALLSDGRCQLLAEYPLLADTLARPYAETAKLPPFDGATPEDRRRWVRLSSIVATRPYRLDALTVVLSAHKANHPVHSLTDLDGMRIGVPIATLADAIAMRYGGGRLIEHVVHLPDAEAVFDGLQSGSLDAAFLDLRTFDARRAQRGSGGLAPTGYVHSLAFNMGFVGLAANAALISQADAALAELERHDAVAPLAAAAGLTFLPPRFPAVQPDVRPAALAGD